MAYPIEDLEDRARADYRAVLGKEILADFVYGYNNTDGEDWLDECAQTTPFRLIVVETPDQDLTRRCDGWIDPYWDARPAPGETRLGHLRSLWTDGTSYNVNGDVQGHWRFAEVSEAIA